MHRKKLFHFRNLTKNGLLIVPVVDNEQSSLWTGDNYNPLIARRIALDGGSVSLGNYGGSYICPVHSIR